MRPALLAQLGFADHLGNLVGTAVLARAAAIQTLRIEGPSRRMQDLAALSTGVMAILDSDVTRRSAAGLASTLAGTPSALSAIAGGIAVATGTRPLFPPEFIPEPEIPSAPSLDWLVFSLLQTVLAAPELEAGLYRLPGRYPDEILAAIGRDDGQPVGRLGIPAYRWMRLVTSADGPERAVAARWILVRGAEDAERAMRDSFHWQNLHAGIAPVEPELLLASLVLLRSALSSPGPFQADILSIGHPVGNAALASAADMLRQERIAVDLGGPTAEISGEAGDRWQEWLTTIGDGPLKW